MEVQKEKEGRGILPNIEHFPGKLSALSVLI